MKIRLFGYEFIVRKYKKEVPMVPVLRRRGTYDEARKSGEALLEAIRLNQEKSKLPKCPVMQKRSFTRADAKIEAEATKAPGIRFYCCEFCNHWHLTHVKNNLKKH